METALRSHMAWRLRQARQGLRICAALGLADIAAMYRAEMSTMRGISSVMKSARKGAE